MKVTWNNKSILLAASLLLSVFLVWFYGQLYFLQPLKERAEQTEQRVADQRNLLEMYPPEEALLNEYQADYAETQQFLPGRENINQAMIELEEAAQAENVTLIRVSRIGEPQPVEGLESTYLKSGYQVEMTSTSSESMRRLVDQLMQLERVWNIPSFRFERYGTDQYTGVLTFELFYHTMDE